MSLSAQTIELAQQLGQLLVAKRWSISCAESCTGGGVGYAITSVSGSSSWFQRGFITYSNQAKTELLGVSDDMLEQSGAVSAPVVKQMAAGAAIEANSTLAIAVSGVAGPTGGTKDKPVGTVYFGLATPDGLLAYSQHFAGDRDKVRAQSIDYALQCAIHYLSSKQ